MGGEERWNPAVPDPAMYRELEAGEMLTLNAPCCTEIQSFPKWFLVSQISRRDQGWKSLYSLGVVSNQVGLQI